MDKEHKEKRIDMYSGSDKKYMVKVKTVLLFSNLWYLILKQKPIVVF